MPRFVLTALDSGAEALDAHGHCRVSARRHGGTVSPLLHHLQQQKASTTTPSQADEDALIDAAKSGNVKEVLRLLDKGVYKECKNLVQILLFSLIHCARTPTNVLLIKKYPPPPFFFLIIIY